MTDLSNVTITVDGTDRTNRLIRGNFTRENYDGVGQFTCLFIDTDNALDTAFQENQTVKFSIDGIPILYGYLTTTTQNKDNTLTASGVAYKGKFTKTRPTYQFYGVNSRDIVQKLIMKSIREEYQTNAKSASTIGIAGTAVWRAQKLTANSDYQFLDSIIIYLSTGVVGDGDKSDKPFLICGVYPDNGSGSPDCSSAPETYSIIDTPVYDSTNPSIPVIIDFKDLIKCDVNKWLVFHITDEVNANVLIYTSSTGTFTGKYSSDSGSTWSGGTELAMTTYGLKRSTLDIQNYFDSGDTTNYSVESSNVMTSIKDLTEANNKSFFDRFIETGSAFTYLKLLGNSLDEYSHTTWANSNISWSTHGAIFNGNNSYIWTAKNETYWRWATEFTINFYLYLTTYTYGDRIMYATSSGDNGWTITLQLSGKLIFTICNNVTGDKYVYSDSILPLGTWLHVIITRDKNNDVFMYINGIKQSLTINNTQNIYPDGSYIYLGAGASSFDGEMKEVKFSKESNQGLPNQLLHWEAKTTTANTECKIDEKVNVLNHNIVKTEVVNSCTVSGMNRNGQVIMANYKDDASITTYGLKEYPIRKDNLNSFEDCYNVAKAIVTSYKDPNISGQATILWSVKTDYDITKIFPNTIPVKIDSKGIDDSYVAQKVTWNFPAGTVNVSFAEDLSTFQNNIYSLNEGQSGLKQTKNLQSADNVYTIDFTTSRDTLEQFIHPTSLSDSLGIKHSEGIGAVPKNSVISWILPNGITTNEKMTNYRVALDGDNVNNTITFLGDNLEYRNLPISKTIVSTGIYTNDFIDSTGSEVTFMTYIMPNTLYGTDGGTLFKFDMKGNSETVLIDLDLGAAGIVTMCPVYSELTIIAYLVITEDKKMHLMSLDWLVLTTINLSINSYFTSLGTYIPSGVCCLYCDYDADVWIILVNAYSGTTGRVFVYWLNTSRIINVTKGNYYFTIPDMGDFGYVGYDMAHSEWTVYEGGGYKDYFQMATTVKNTSTGNYAIAPMYLFTDTYLLPSSWNLYWGYGTIRMSGYNYGANKTINGIEYVYGEGLAGTSNYSSKYMLCVAENFEEKAYSFIHYSFKDNLYTQMPHRTEYVVANDTFFPHDIAPASGFPATKSICKGPANTVLRGIEIQMFKDNTKFELPKYLDITDYE